VYYLLNIYQTNSFLHGGPITGVLLPALLEEFNTTTHSFWDGSLNHSSIDDDFLVQDLIVSRLHAYLLER
jgi:hypothetical protein